MHVHHVQKYLNMMAISESISDEQKQITETKKHRNATATPQQFQEKGMFATILNDQSRDWKIGRERFEQ